MAMADRRRRRVVSGARGVYSEIDWLREFDADGALDMGRFHYVCRSEGSLLWVLGDAFLLGAVVG